MSKNKKKTKKYDDKPDLQKKKKMCDKIYHQDKAERDTKCLTKLYVYL